MILIMIISLTNLFRAPQSSACDAARASVHPFTVEHAVHANGASKHVGGCHFHHAVNV